MPDPSHPTPSASSAVTPLASAAADASRPVLLLPVPELPGLDESGLPRLVLAFRRVAGETVAECFTSRVRLVGSCGPKQPWVAYSVADSIRLVADAGATVLLVDPGPERASIAVDLTHLASRPAGAER
jgi:hypothetical protein